MGPSEEASGGGAAGPKGGGCSQAKGKKACLWPDRAGWEGQPTARSGRLTLGQDAGSKARASEETTCDRWEAGRVQEQPNKTTAVMGVRRLT